jgi:hypothetical protein
VYILRASLHVLVRIPRLYSPDPYLSLRNHSPHKLVTRRLARLFLLAETRNAHIYRSTEPRYLPPSTAALPVFQTKLVPRAGGLFATVISMQARPRPSLDTNVSQYASHALRSHSADSGPSSSTTPCDSAASSLVDPFAPLCEDSRDGRLRQFS